MIFLSEVLIEKSTSYSDSVIAVIQVLKGLVYKIELEFPAGCAGLAGLAIWDGGLQVWPATSGTFFHTDDNTISYEDMYMKLTQPYEFQVRGYNEDTENDHTIQVRIGLAEREMFMARFIPAYAYEQMEAILDRREEEAETERRLILESTIFGEF